ncbi:MAG: deoxyribose-phosphate aldolase [Candidatus Cloacimonetes bacterium]|nr:deoxyribose-phosphate aldolase [Candidatus Cloacimonadota bacterium]
MDLIEKIAREHFPSRHLCRCGGGHKICLECNECRVDHPDRTFQQDAGIASIIDATVLKADAIEEMVKDLCSTALRHQCASVCVNSHYIPLVRECLGERVKSCTVINFPLGANEFDSIFAEARAAVELGIDELDMVQNLPAMLNGELDKTWQSLSPVALLCIERGVLLKVILETCYLTPEQIILSCLYAKKAGALYVKTSTGFGSAGATEEHIALMRKTVGPKLGVKASGGIRTKVQAQEMVAAGANRIGASSVQALL